MLDDVTAAAAELQDWLADRKPPTAIVLGSGFAAIGAELSGSRTLAYHKLTGFPNVGVAGHAGQIHCGELDGREVLLLAGRYHYYEGYDAWQTTALIRLAKAVGCRRLLLTNAVGGIAAGMLPGDFMLVSDHLNLSGINPLRGSRGKRFVDLSRLYRQDFYAPLAADCRQEGIALQRGILAWMPGPSYETPAEIRALAALGAAAVSMSTIPEAIVARQQQLDVAALSLIANPAAGISDSCLSHSEVLAVAERAQTACRTVVKRLLVHWDQSPSPS
jgi:purine-nucleoside phosphorylase